MNSFVHKGCMQITKDALLIAIQIMFDLGSFLSHCTFTGY